MIIPVSALRARKQSVRKGKKEKEIERGLKQTENHRIVCGAVDFCLDHRLAKVDCVPCHSMHLQERSIVGKIFTESQRQRESSRESSRERDLGHATKSVAVLDTRAELVALVDL